MVFLLDHELTVRTEARGGTVATQVQLGPGDTIVGRGSAVVLIHGYCNDLEDARESYSTFKNHCSALSNKLWNFPADIFNFYWPGDKAWGWLRFASYSWEIGPAIESARVLANFLRELPTITDIYFIAHSLGNRLLLELLKEFALKGAPPTVQVKGAILMAAAVPISAVRPTGDLSSATSYAKTKVLYSPGDLVLHFGFALGETLALDAALPEAVGLNGLPVLQWPNRNQMRYGPKKTKDYNHGDYWPQKETCEPVARFLESAPPNTLSKYSVARRTPQEPNQLITNAIAKYRTPARP